MYRPIGEKRGRNKYLADNYFLTKHGISPMAAFFLALPIKKKIVSELGEIIVRTDFVDMVMRAGSRSDDNISGHFAGMPCGMHARRIMLYIFSETYKSECAGIFPHEIRLGSGTQADFLRCLGYQTKTGFTGNHPANEQLQRLTNCEFDVARKDKRILLDFIRESNAKCDFKDMHIFADTRYSKKRNAIGMNVKFPFSLAIPVDYEQAKKLDGKSLSWNIYVFLADMLPRIPKQKTLELPWEKVNHWFGSRYPEVRKFRYNFKLALENVLERYPAAVGKVHDSSREILTLKYAEPPIKHNRSITSRLN